MFHNVCHQLLSETLAPLTSIASLPLTSGIWKFTYQIFNLLLCVHKWDGIPWGWGILVRTSQQCCILPLTFLTCFITVRDSQNILINVSLVKIKKNTDYFAFTLKIALIFTNTQKTQSIWNLIFFFVHGVLIPAPSPLWLRWNSTGHRCLLFPRTAMFVQIFAEKKRVINLAVVAAASSGEVRQQRREREGPRCWAWLPHGPQGKLEFVNAFIARNCNPCF